MKHLSTSLLLICCAVAARAQSANAGDASVVLDALLLGKSPQPRHVIELSDLVDDAEQRGAWVIAQAEVLARDDGALAGVPLEERGPLIEPLLELAARGASPDVERRAGALRRVLFPPPPPADPVARMVIATTPAGVTQEWEAVAGNLARLKPIEGFALWAKGIPLLALEQEGLPEWAAIRAAQPWLAPALVIESLRSEPIEFSNARWLGAQLAAAAKAWQSKRATFEESDQAPGVTAKHVDAAFAVAEELLLRVMRVPPAGEAVAPAVRRARHLAAADEFRRLGLWRWELASALLAAGSGGEVRQSRLAELVKLHEQVWVDLPGDRFRRIRQRTSYGALKQWTERLAAGAAAPAAGQMSLEADFAVRRPVARISLERDQRATLFRTVPSQFNNWFREIQSAKAAGAGAAAAAAGVDLDAIRNLYMPGGELRATSDFYLELFRPEPGGDLIAMWLMPVAEGARFRMDAAAYRTGSIDRLLAEVLPEGRSINNALVAIDANLSQAEIERVLKRVCTAQGDARVWLLVTPAGAALLPKSGWSEEAVFRSLAQTPGLDWLYDRTVVTAVTPPEIVPPGTAGRVVWLGPAPGTVASMQWPQAPRPCGDERAAAVVFNE